MQCSIPKATHAARVPCPACRQVGRPVGGATVESILQPGAVALLGDEPRFCRTRECDVVYYGSEGSSARKEQSRVRVGIKEREHPVPVCYCFGFTKADIERELLQTGSCTIAARVTAEVKAGNCACELKNPSGACCLGDVHREVKEAKLHFPSAAKTGT